MTDNRETIILQRGAQKGRGQERQRHEPDLQGGPNIVKVMDVVNDRRSHQPAVILEFVKSTLYDASSSMTPMDIQVMLYKLLGALNFTHSKGYMHRDIKPRNVMVDINKQELRLVDWNIAERYIPGELYSMKCMTLPYKAPELLTNMQDYHYSIDVWGLGLSMDYDYSLDMWGFGLSMATLIFNVNRLWTGEDKADQDKLLRYDPAERLTAAEALQHPYFKPLAGIPTSAQLLALVRNSCTA
eukprot:gene22730-29894_t